MHQASDERHRIAARYRDFAQDEARGVSPVYEALALGIAGCEPLIRFLATLPDAKRQPNLFLAAVRWLHGVPRDSSELERVVRRHGDAIRALMLARSTQTNEPGRCATLLPALARLPEPLALLEVGSSAGLCLLPDAWGYDYGRARIEPDPAFGEGAPIFPCRSDQAAPLPARVPRIAWRAGLDLAPIDPADSDAVAWLETLVWPGQEARAERLRAALRVAREHPPRVVRGDLLTDLAELAAEAPPDATLVVFHSAVLVYLQPRARERFVAGLARLGAVWVGNEAPGVLPHIDARLGFTPPASRFVLAVGGEPLALTGPHGQSLEWLSRD